VGGCGLGGGGSLGGATGPNDRNGGEERQHPECGTVDAHRNLQVASKWLRSAGDQACWKMLYGMDEGKKG
jgi:hypothetical protein